MAGGGGGAFNREEANMVGLSKYDHAEFINFRVMVCSKAMEKAGIEVGSTVTHVDGIFINNQDDFAVAVNDLRGKTLRLIAPDNSRREVTLK